MSRVVYADMEYAVTVEANKQLAVYGAGWGKVVAGGAWVWQNRNKLVQSAQIVYNAGKQLYQIWK